MAACQSFAVLQEGWAAQAFIRRLPQGTLLGCWRAALRAGRARAGRAQVPPCGHLRDGERVRRAGRGQNPAAGRAGRHLPRRLLPRLRAGRAGGGDVRRGAAARLLCLVAAGRAPAARPRRPAALWGGLHVVLLHMVARAEPLRHACYMHGLSSGTGQPASTMPQQSAYDAPPRQASLGAYSCTGRLC